MKLHSKAFGLACGLFSGVGLFMLTWWMLIFKEPEHEKTFIGRVYRGYNISPKGSVIGLLWALADGFVAGWLFALLYNSLIGEKRDNDTATSGNQCGQ